MSTWKMRAVSMARLTTWNSHTFSIRVQTQVSYVWWVLNFSIFITDYEHESGHKNTNYVYRMPQLNGSHFIVLNTTSATDCLVSLFQEIGNTRFLDIWVRETETYISALFIDFGQFMPVRGLPLSLSVLRSSQPPAGLQIYKEMSVIR